MPCAQERKASRRPPNPASTPCRYPHFDTKEMTNSTRNRAPMRTARGPARPFSSAGASADIRKLRISRKITCFSPKDVGKDKASTPGRIPPSAEKPDESGSTARGSRWGRGWFSVAQLARSGCVPVSSADGRNNLTEARVRFSPDHSRPAMYNGAERTIETRSVSEGKSLSRPRLRFALTMPW